MKLVQFRVEDGAPRIGVLQDDRIFDAALLNDPPRNLSAVIEGWDIFESTLQAAVTEIVTAGVIIDHPLVYEYADVELLAPVMPQGLIICVGMNYPDPAALLDEKPEYPVLFLKDQRTLHRRWAEDRNRRPRPGRAQEGPLRPHQRLHGVQGNHRGDSSHARRLPGVQTENRDPRGV